MGQFSVERVSERGTAHGDAWQSRGGDRMTAAGWLAGYGYAPPVTNTSPPRAPLRGSEATDGPPSRNGEELIYISARDARGQRESIPVEAGQPLRYARRETDGEEASVRPRAGQLARREIRERNAGRNQEHDARARRRPAGELQGLSRVPREAPASRRLVLFRCLSATRSLGTDDPPRQDGPLERPPVAAVARWR